MKEYLLFVVAVLLISDARALDLPGMSDDELLQVSGREGIALDIEFRLNTGADGKPLDNLSHCSQPGNPCSMALQFNNRPDEWLVLKDLYGTLHMDNLWLDAHDTGTPAQNPHADPSRFIRGGECLVKPGATGANCNANNLPALAMGFPGKANIFEPDLQWQLMIGRATVQYGEHAYLPSADVNRSFLSLQLTDKVHGAARIDLDGKILMFGF